VVDEPNVTDEELDDLFPDAEEEFEEYMRKSETRETRETREAREDLVAAAKALQDMDFERKSAKSPFDVFCAYHQLQCDHNIYPMADEAWNGAVEIVAEYMVNEIILDIDEDIHPDVWEAYRDKVKAKFLVK